MTTEIIGLDPGHPPFGCDVGGMSEADWTLLFAHEVKAELGRLGIPCVLLRLDRGAMSLEARAIAAKKRECTRVLSLHVNTNNDPRVRGPVAFHTGPEGRRLGDAIMEELDDGGVYVSSGDKEQPRKLRSIEAAFSPHWTSRAYKVLRGYQCPATLLEVGFATNADDLACLLDASWRQGAAEKIAKAIARVAR